MTALCTLLPILGKTEPDGMTSCIPECTKGITTGSRSQLATSFPMPSLGGNSSPVRLLVPSVKEGCTDRHGVIGVLPGKM